MRRILIQTHPLAHTVSTGQHMWFAFLHSLAHTQTHTELLHTCNEYVCSRRMHKYEPARTHYMHAAHHLHLLLKLALTHKNTLPVAAFACKPLRAQTAPTQSASTTVTLGRLSISFFTLTCKKLCSYHRSYVVIQNALLWNQFSSSRTYGHLNICMTRKWFIRPCYVYWSQPTQKTVSLRRFTECAEGIWYGGGCVGCNGSLLNITWLLAYLGAAFWADYYLSGMHLPGPSLSILLSVFFYLWLNRHP